MDVVHEGSNYAFKCICLLTLLDKHSVCTINTSSASSIQALLTQKAGNA
jgi:hypothetical protein